MSLAKYHAALDEVQEAVKKAHAASREAEDKDPAIVTAWITVLGAVALDDKGNPVPSVFVLGPPSVPFWQDIGLLKTALARYTK